MINNYHILHVVYSVVGLFFFSVVQEVFLVVFKTLIG